MVEIRSWYPPEAEEMTKEIRKNNPAKTATPISKGVIIPETPSKTLEKKKRFIMMKRL